MSKKLFAVEGKDGWLRCLSFPEGEVEYTSVFERDIFTEEAWNKLRPFVPFGDVGKELISNPFNFGRKLSIDKMGNLQIKERAPYAFLRMGSDYLSEAKRYKNKTQAINAYREAMEELARYGQEIEATIHYSVFRDRLDEYPDFVLSPGVRGGVRCVKA